MRGETYIKMEKLIYNQLILKEGYSKIGIALGLTLILFAIGFSFFAKVGILVTLALLWIYRNNLSIINNPANLSDTIYAPIDGKIASIDRQNGIQKVYIDVDLCGSHILRAPVTGTFYKAFWQKGLNLSSWSFKSKNLNNKVIVSFQENDGTFTKMEIVSGFCGSDIILYDNQYQFVTREPMGVFIQGTVIIEIASNYAIKVSIGEKITGGISVLAGKIE